MLIWLGRDKKGTYTALDPPFRALRRSFEIDLEELEEEKDKSPAQRSTFQRPWSFNSTLLKFVVLLGQYPKPWQPGVDRLWLR